MTTMPMPARPFLRGYIHLGAAVVAPLALVWLILRADSPASITGAAIFGASTVALYTASASYHVVPWGRRLRGLVMRIDHSMIFVLIGGTYTPFCLAMGIAWGIPILSVVWSLAAVGVVTKCAWPDAPRWLGVAAYLALGWLALVAATPIWVSVSPSALLLILAAGVLYSLGGIAYAVRWPNPSSRVFGHHEVFHALVVAGSAVVYTAVAAYAV